MTKERAIDLCKAIDIYLCTGNPIWDVEEIHDAMSMAIEALKARQWIPVSERLPEPHKAVLAYAPKYNNIWAVTITDSGKWLMWTPGILYEYNQDFNGELVAWMECPEPYKEDES